MPGKPKVQKTHKTNKQAKINLEEKMLSLQVSKTFRIPNNYDEKRSLPKHIHIKLSDVQQQQIFFSDFRENNYMQRQTYLYESRLLNTSFKEQKSLEQSISSPNSHQFPTRNNIPRKNFPKIDF